MPINERIVSKVNDDECFLSERIVIEAICDDCENDIDTTDPKIEYIDAIGVSFHMSCFMKMTAIEFLEYIKYIDGIGVSFLVSSFKKMTAIEFLECLHGDIFISNQGQRICKAYTREGIQRINLYGAE